MLHGSRGAVFSKRVPLAAGGKSNFIQTSLSLIFRKWISPMLLMNLVLGKVLYPRSEAIIG
jgi:hypothetical protein